MLHRYKHDIEPNTPAWLELRKQYRTASEAAIVLGISPFTSVEKFKRIKEGQITQHYSAAMRRGHQLEDSVRQWANQHFGLSLVEEIWTCGAYLASLDGIDAGVVVEIKASSHTYHDLVNGRVPAHYEVQVQQQLYCSGAKVAFIVAICPKTGKFARSNEIFPDPAVMQRIERAWEIFDALNLSHAEPAQVPLVRDDDLELVDLFSQYAQIQQQLQRLQDRSDHLRLSIMNHVPPERSLSCAGHLVEYRKPSVKTDYKRAAIDAGLDLSKYQSTGPSCHAIKLKAHGNQSKQSQDLFDLLDNF